MVIENQGQEPKVSDCTQKESEHVNNRYKEETHRLNKRQFVVAVITLIVLVIYTSIAGYQAWQMRRATDAARDSADATTNAVKDSRNAVQLDERAWIGPVDSPIIDWEVGKKFAVAIPLKNTGKTPGTNVTTLMAIRPLSPQKMPLFTDLVTPTGHGVLQPSAVTYLAVFGDGAISRADFDAVKSGKLTIWVYGRITYDDIFGRHHWTTFAQTFNPIKRGLDTYGTNNEVDTENPNQALPAH